MPPRWGWGYGVAWRKAMRFCALWQEAILRSATLTSCNFTLADKKAAYAYFRTNPTVFGLFPLAVAICAWKLALEGIRPKRPHRHIYHIPHSLDPRQFRSSMNTGKIEAEVGLFGKVNTWATLRGWFTESELVYFGWSRIPVIALEPEDSWEYDPDALSYYLDRHRDVPPEVQAASQHAGADAQTCG